VYTLFQSTLISTSVINNEPIKLIETETNENQEENNNIPNHAPSSSTVPPPTSTVASSVRGANVDITSAVHSMLAHQPCICLANKFYLPSRIAFQSSIDTKFYFLVVFSPFNSFSFPLFSFLFFLFLFLVLFLFLFSPILLMLY
jgi:hypothetical protein